ncbi:MAG: hypothetical protein IJD72_02450 [Alistipes sp.]|nr:hypothetical protein [Alistipes sp.]
MWAILPHHKGGVSSSRLSIVRKRPLLSPAASVEAARRWGNRKSIFTQKVSRLPKSRHLSFNLFLKSG